MSPLILPFWNWNELGVSSLVLICEWVWRFQARVPRAGQHICSGSCVQPLFLLGVTQQVWLDGPDTATARAMEVTHLICAYHHSKDCRPGLKNKKNLGSPKSWATAVLKADKNGVQKLCYSYVTFVWGSGQFSASKSKVERTSKNTLIFGPTMDKDIYYFSMTDITDITAAL